MLEGLVDRDRVVVTGRLGNGAAVVLLGKMAAGLELKGFRGSSGDSSSKNPIQSIDAFLDVDCLPVLLPNFDFLICNCLFDCNCLAASSSISIRSSSISISANSMLASEITLVGGSRSELKIDFLRSEKLELISDHKPRDEDFTY